MIKDRNKEDLKETIKLELLALKEAQINLNSTAAIDNLANHIANSLMGKFYMVSYMSQESFE